MARAASSLEGRKARAAGRDRRLLTNLVPAMAGDVVAACLTRVDAIEGNWPHHLEP